MVVPASHGWGLTVTPEETGTYCTPKCIAYSIINMHHAVPIKPLNV